MKNKNLKRSSLKQAIIAFVFTFIIVSFLITAQFLWKYQESIFQNNLDLSFILEITYRAMLNLMIHSVPVSLLIASIAYFHSVFKKGERKLNIKAGIILSLFISAFGFIWVAFITPSNNMNFYGLLFDIRSKPHDKPLERNDPTIFKGSKFTSNYIYLGEQIDSLTQAALTQSYSSPYQAEQQKSYLSSLMRERMKMAGYPFYIFTLLFLGMSIGIWSRKNKLIYYILGTGLFILPLIYLLQIYIENLQKEYVLSPFTGQLLHLLIIAIITSVLFMVGYRKYKIENKNQTNW